MVRRLANLTRGGNTGFAERLQTKRSNAELVGDIVSMILFLASDESRSCTGGDFPVESGHTAGKILKGAPGA